MRKRDQISELYFRVEALERESYDILHMSDKEFDCYMKLRQRQYYSHLEAMLITRGVKDLENK